MGGIRVAGEDGLLHGGGGGSLGPVHAVSGIGPHRVAVHDRAVTIWEGDRQRSICDIGIRGAELRVDRDGELLLARPSRGPMQVFKCKDGSPVFDGGPETSSAVDMAVGGSVVAVMLKSGGCRWWDLASRRGFELHWPRAMALTGGGTWLAVVTPKGVIKVLDPATGEEAVQPPVPLAEVPVRHMSFINRQPDLLVIDQDGVVGHYDLGKSVTRKQPAHGRDVITINVEVDRIWGITGGQYCAVRLPEEDGSTILWIDIHACEVVQEVTGLQANAWVDSESGLILETARSSAILERTMSGKEHRVLRALPDGEWIVFGGRGILEASENAANAMT
jgi:hypothetical protein